MAAAYPMTSAHKHLVPDFPTGSLAREVCPRGNGSASRLVLAPHLRSKEGIRLLQAICMSPDPKGAASMVTRDSWDKLILRCECPVLVEFYASWCRPCRRVHKVMDEITGEYEGKIAHDYEVKAVPVVMVFKDGEKGESVIGTMPKSFYEAVIHRAMDS